MEKLIELKGGDMHHGGFNVGVHECGFALYDVHIVWHVQVSVQATESAYTMLL